MDSKAIGELAAANGAMLHELSPQHGSLEEAFMRLTGDSVDYHATTLDAALTESTSNLASVWT